MNGDMILHHSLPTEDDYLVLDLHVRGIQRREVMIRKEHVTSVADTRAGGARVEVGAVSYHVVATAREVLEALTRVPKPHEKSKGKLRVVPKEEEDD